MPLGNAPTQVLQGGSRGSVNVSWVTALLKKVGLFVRFESDSTLSLSSKQKVDGIVQDLGVAHLGGVFASMRGAVEGESILSPSPISIGAGFSTEAAIAHTPFILSHGARFTFLGMPWWSLVVQTLAGQARVVSRVFSEGTLSLAYGVVSVESGPLWKNGEHAPTEWGKHRPGSVSAWTREAPPSSEKSEWKKEETQASRWKRM